MDRQTFAQISGIVRRKTPHGDWKSVRRMIFDAPRAEGGFEQPLAFTREWLEQQPNPYVSIIKHEVCKDEQHLRKRLADALDGKRLIIRRSVSANTVGRPSTI